MTTHNAPADKEKHLAQNLSLHYPKNLPLQFLPMLRYNDIQSLQRNNSNSTMIAHKSSTTDHYSELELKTAAPPLPNTLANSTVASDRPSTELDESLHQQVLKLETTPVV